jgi:FkbM family methyltransferase
MFRAQFGEDEFFSKLFPTGYIGTCVEVGADDGIKYSNTAFFEEIGWKCLCIEPILEQFEKCKSTRKNAVNCCAGAENKDDTIFHAYYLHDGTATAISSLEPDSRLISQLGHLISSVVDIPVKTRTLDTLLKEVNFPQKIDFISIDTENTELDVLKGIDLDFYDVTYFIIENNYNEPHCIDYLTKKGYNVITRLGVNDIFKKQSQT